MNYSDLLLKLKESNQYQYMVNSKDVGGRELLQLHMIFDINNYEMMASMLNFEKSQYLSGLLIELDYATYIPFGIKGLRHLQKCLKQEGSLTNAIDYKKQQMYRVVKRCGAELNNELKNSIDKFCDYLFTVKQNLSEIESVAASVRIVSGELDNLVSNYKMGSINEKDDNCERILDTMVDYTKTNGKEINLKEFFDFDKEDLNEKEANYFERFTGLKLTNETTK